MALALAAMRPGLAAACAACGLGPNDRSNWAFLAGTILLSLMPLAVMGGIAYYLVRAWRRQAKPSEDPTWPHPAPRTLS